MELDQILLVRDVILTVDGKLSPGSLSIAAGLQIPHHVGAGGDKQLCVEDGKDHRATAVLSLFFVAQALGYLRNGIIIKSSSFYIL